MKKIEKIHERALRFLYNDSNRSYDDLLSKAEKCTMKIGRLRALCIEIYKTVSKLNPPFMQDIFKLTVCLIGANSENGRLGRLGIVFD